MMIEPLRRGDHESESESENASASESEIPMGSYYLNPLDNSIERN